MAGYTNNFIVINAPIDFVFDVTNDVANWPNLFTEYESAEVIEKTQEKIVFRLTTKPNEEGRVYSWQAVRRIDHDNYQTFSVRQDAFPFSYMKIHWTYDPLDDHVTEMTWIQEFDMDPNSDVTAEQAENYINSNTVVQMKIIKEKIERMAQEAKVV